MQYVMGKWAPNLFEAMVIREKSGPLEGRSIALEGLCNKHFILVTEFFSPIVVHLKL